MICLVEHRTIDPCNIKLSTMAHSYFPLLTQSKVNNPIVFTGIFLQIFSFDRQVSVANGVATGVATGGATGGATGVATV